MSALVGYGSSDEEDENSPERPAKIARTEAHGAATSVKEVDVDQLEASQQIPPRGPQLQPQAALHTSTDIPAPGPSIPNTGSIPPTESTTPISAPASPYTTERQRIQNLTMPTVPNFSIPDSPPPPPTNSEEAAVLAATTRKFERFLELKRQGTHFNDRLAKSASLRNPSLLPKLMEFAGISVEESHRSTLPEELGVPTKWREESYVESLVKANERKTKEKRKDRLEFVAATKSAGSSKASTPNSNPSESRRGTFDKR